MPRKNHRAIKTALVESFGGQCERCGYNQCLRALQFHHKDPLTKAEWSGSRGSASLDEVAAHPDRFILLCANCHFEEHEAQDRANKIYLSCPVCGRPFPVEPYRLNQSRDKFCSRKCQHKQRELDAPANLPNRFWKYVEKTADCWLWTGTTMQGGYGCLQVKSENGKYAPRLAHRISYALHVGAIPPRAVVTHTCPNAHCVNPDHLVLGTRSEAMKGKAARTNIVLTEAQALEVRQRYAAGGTTYAKLAREFDVGPATIADIVRRRTWSHLP